MKYFVICLPLTDDCIAHSIAVSDMPELKWYRISSLGFGFEKDKGNNNAESENELLDYAASLFATCNQPFSILSERKDGEIVYAIGCAEENLAPILLKSAFGTVKSESYTPVFSVHLGYMHTALKLLEQMQKKWKRENLFHPYICQNGWTLSQKC